MMHTWRRLKVVLALALLGAWVVSGFALWQVFNLAQQYYRELNAVRLDPLGTTVIWPDVPPLTEGQQRLVLFGDSRAQDWLLTSDATLQVVNRGIGAQTTAQIIGRFDQHVALLGYSRILAIQFTPPQWLGKGLKQVTKVSSPCKGEEI